MNLMRGKLDGKGKRIGIVVSEFNEFITKRLLASTVETLMRAGVTQKNVTTVWVPGSLEVPFFCKKVASQVSKKPDVVIAIACVLRGDTFHYECVAHELTRGISQAALETGIPVATAVITADSLDQAIDRAGLKAGNKGRQAALAALEIADLNRRLMASSKR
ncbi:MAG: 6,7-dimethyl-8-ribityllumazine synthase [Omnitrophica bacterium GWA2_52_8]|nr:MAG: 6,7-dimethyl-8-ribityllumazine synthase [Omnitrophica bacterium GWA2_52_8]